jgi:hypothetical protein
MEAQLHLDKPRTIAISDGSNTFVYKFRRIVESDWKKFFNGIVNESETDAKGHLVQTIDGRTALFSLVEETLQSVDGFRIPGDVPLDQVKDWKQKLPLGQKLVVGLLLKDIDAIPDSMPTLGDTMDVNLKCKWTASDEGKMVEISGLIHRFQPPSIEQLKTYNRESARSIVVGGSRTGRTISPGRQGLLAKLYDELIVSVDGYCVNGIALTGVEAIRAQMDTCHKVSAAEHLFALPTESNEQEAA